MRVFALVVFIVWPAIKTASRDITKHLDQLFNSVKFLLLNAIHNLTIETKVS